LAPSLRVARVDISGYRLPTAELAGLDDLHRELQTLIRRHLPGVAASVFTLPVPCADGKTVDWYSDLPGQPTRLTALPAVRRAAMKAKLEERLDALRRLADALPTRVKGSESIAALLRAATRYPDDSHVYVIGDEPVLTLWGFVLVEERGHGRSSGPALASASAPEPPVRRRLPRGWRWGWAGAIVLILGAGLAGGGWLWLDRRETDSLAAELQAALDTACAGPDLLGALALRIDRLDPQRKGYAELRERIATEQTRCAAAESLDREVIAANWDCARLAEIRQGLAGSDGEPPTPGPDLDREPFAGILARLEMRVGVCETSAQAAAELERRLGNCPALTELGVAVGLRASEAASEDPPDQTPWRPVREQLARELARCAEADRIVVALDAALEADDGGCSAILKLDRESAGLDVARPPLTALRERLDTELARCARAQTYRQKLVDAQMDCAALRTLDRELTVEDAEREPLRAIRGRLDEALLRCDTLEKLEEAVGEGLKRP
jgi:hypothetical protein